MEGRNSIEGNYIKGVYEVLRSNINIIIFNIGIFFFSSVSYIMRNLVRFLRILKFEIVR